MANNFPIFDKTTLSPMNAATLLCCTNRSKILLARILFWQQHASICRDGFVWIAKDRKTWADETGLTDYQVKKGLADLRGRSLIVTKQWLFGGKNITHITVTEEANSRLKTATRFMSKIGGQKYFAEISLETVRAALDAPTPEGENAPTPVGAFRPTLCKEDSKETKGEIEEATPEKNISSISEESTSGKDLKLAKLKKSFPDSNNLTEKTTGKEGYLVKLAELTVANMNKGSEAPSVANPAPHKYFEDVWKESLFEHHDKIVGKFTGAELGKAKHTLIKLADVGIDDQKKMKQFIWYIVENWLPFCQKVEADKALKKTPAMPDIGFLLVHTYIGADMYYKHDLKGYNDQSKPKEGKLTFPNTKKPSVHHSKFISQCKVKEPKVTLEEMFESPKATEGDDGHPKQSS